jgi:hypothetical protein
MGDVKMVSMLLPYCNKRGKAGKELLETALIRAARHGHLKVMHLLLQHGAHVNGTWDSIDFALKGWHVYSVTPTGFALSAKQWAAAELLIDAGAKVSEHLLFMAAEHGAPASTVRALVEKGARDIDNEAILTAAMLGHQDIVVELLRVDQQSVSKEDLMARFAEAFAGAAIGDQPSLVHHLCATLDHRLQDSTNTCGPADRQEFLSEALIKVIDMHHLQWIEAPDSSDQAPHDEMEPQPTAGGGSNGGDDVAPAVDGSHGEQSSDLGGGTSNQQQAAHNPHGLRYRVIPAEPHLITAVQYLLQQGVDPNFEQGLLLAHAVGRQYHHGAVPCRDHAILQLLLDAGANVVDRALLAAVGVGDTAAIPRLLAASQGPVDQQGKALLAAAESGNKFSSVIDSLLRNGSNVAAALHSAAAAYDVQAAVVLLEHPLVRVIDPHLKQALADLAARKQSFKLIWALSRATGILDDCQLPACEASKVER